MVFLSSYESLPPRREGYLDDVCFASSIRRAQDSGDSNRKFNVHIIHFIDI